LPRSKTHHPPLKQLGNVNLKPLGGPAKFKLVNASLTAAAGSVWPQIGDDAVTLMPQSNVAAGFRK
jgi:hypothetical protein